MAAKSINAYLEYNARKGSLKNTEYIAQDGEPMLEKLKFFREFDFPLIL